MITVRARKHLAAELEVNQVPKPNSLLCQKSTTPSRNCVPDACSLAKTGTTDGFLPFTKLTAGMGDVVVVIYSGSEPRTLPPRSPCIRSGSDACLPRFWHTVHVHELVSRPVVCPHIESLSWPGT